MRRKIGIILLILILAQFTVVNAYGQEKDMQKDQEKDRWERKLKDLTPDEVESLENLINNYFWGKTVFSTINLLLMAYLTWFHYVIYRGNKSNFSLGLIALSAALLVYSLSSNPWLVKYLWFFNIKKEEFLEYRIFFNLFPELFTTVAAIIMVYQTRK
jgi:hypothetical protein